MHVKPRNRTRIIVIMASFVAVITGGLIYVLGGSSTAAQSAGSLRPVVVVQSEQPASAQAIATAVNCNHFTDLGPGHLLSIDSGDCYINGKKYGVNTFATKDARDSWLKIAETLGVNPKWETDTSVVYPSTD
jgi:hypothetical protein